MSPLKQNESDNERIFVVIPAFNESEHLGQVIFGIQNYLPHAQIIVVNDGSDDDTSDVARRCGVRLIEHQINLGKGAALTSGFNVALEEGCTYIAIIDGDGQHEPRYLVDLITAIRYQGADIAVGSRMSDISTMPFHRILSNKITSMLVSWRAGGVRIEDSQCGLRVIRADVLKNIKLSVGGFQTESEMLIRAGRKGYEIVTIPISTVYGISKSSIRHIGDTLKFIILILRSLFW